ncbi:transposase [Hyalangium versicolor]|uniref:transposase n=1 Tax=Hyalangium versicolor TaxID=2861190 RepID=UPI001CC984F9|nr:transposase [Hyalangium versicolor]
MLAAAEAMVPADHLARRVRKLMEGVDLSQVEAQYSALGRRGYAPRQLLCLWVYASLSGLHHATKLARALVTDTALRLLSGGHAISRPVLNRFRMSQAALFQKVLEQTVKCALKHGWVDAQDLAVDSVRLRAHADPGQVRILQQSQERLKELARVDTATLSELERHQHQQKVTRHTQAVQLCTQAQAASVVLTSPAAALMQFPGDVYLPGHRLTVTASGTQSRMVVGVLLNAAANDTGLLEQALAQARHMLHTVGLPWVVRLQAAADAGYWSRQDLAFAAAHTGWLDVLINEKEPSSKLGKNYFRRDAFELRSVEQVLCPANKPMLGPSYDKAKAAHVYKGDDCEHCPLHASCTPSKQRQLVVNWDYEKHQRAMRERMSQEGAQARYHRRMATVEPVFSYLEDSMGFRRVSSRKPSTVTAEILLKLVAYNISRLFACSSLWCVGLLLRPTGCSLGRSPAFILILILINPASQK